MWARVARKFSLIGVAAASVLSVQPASAGCGCPCGFPSPVAEPCGGFWSEPYAAAAPPQPTFYADEGPTYGAVIVAPEDAQRWLMVPGQQRHPYIHTWYGPQYWWHTQVAADEPRLLPYRRYSAHHHRHW
jgi:hypothetical protein